MTAKPAARPKTDLTFRGLDLCDSCGAELATGNFWGLCDKCEGKDAAPLKPRGES